MAEYLKLAWRHLVLRFLIDIATGALVFIPTCVVAVSIFALGHAVWGMTVRILKQSLSVLAGVPIGSIRWNCGTPLATSVSPH